jgi:hypothetical protein
MHLNDLEKLVNSDEGPFAWMRPDCVQGIDITAVKEMNELRWFQKLKLGDDDDTPDEIIADYLSRCLIRRHILMDDKEPLPSELEIDGVMLVNACIYLICELGSSYAAFRLSIYNELVTEDNVHTCLDLAADAYENSTGFIRDILRDFILDMFRYGPLWQEEGGYFTDVLTPEQNDFLKRVFDQGYLTLDNEDGRLFADGSKLI